MSKHRPPHYRPGSHLKTCDLSGRVDYAENFVKQWNGLVVHKDYYEPRNPQDFVKGVPDKQSVVDPRDDVTTVTTGAPSMVLVDAYNDCTGRYVYVVFNRDIGTASSGLSLTADGDALAILSYTNLGGGILLLSTAQIYQGQTVLLSYTPGNIEPVTGNALEAFTDEVVDNNCTLPVLTGYPLDDDGTVATSLGVDSAVTNAPDYLQADYTYSASVASGIALSMPSSANWLDGQAIIVTAGMVLACECEIVAGPAGGVFGTIGMFALESSGGVFTGNTWTTGALDADGLTPEIAGSGAADAPRVGATNGFRVGMYFDGNTGNVSYVSTDGAFATSSDAFTPGNAITVGNLISDGILTPAGQTCSVRLIPAAANMTLTYPAGAVDVFGDVI